MRRNSHFTMLAIAMLIMFASFSSYSEPPAVEVVVVNTDLNPIRVEIPQTVQVQVSGGTTYRFHELTVARFNGHSGINILDRGCRFEFGTGARMCTSEEFFLSGSDLRNPDLGWLNPSFISIYYDHGKDTVRTVDYSGYSWDGGPDLGNCRRYQANGEFDPLSRGLTLRIGESIPYHLSRTDCRSEVHVVCCLPSE